MMMMIFEGQRGKQALPVWSYTRNFEGSNNSRHPAAAGWTHTSKMSCLWLPSRATAETPVKPSLYRMYLSSSEKLGNEPSIRIRSTPGRFCHVPQLVRALNGGLSRFHSDSGIVAILLTDLSRACPGKYDRACNDADELTHAQS